MVATPRVCHFCLLAKLCHSDRNGGTQKCYRESDRNSNVYGCRLYPGRLRRGGLRQQREAVRQRAQALSRVRHTHTPVERPVVTRRFSDRN
jgi:hypothetical protein